MTLELLAQEIKDILFIFTMGLPRIMACFVMLPILGKKMLGGTLIRNGLIFCFIYFYVSFNQINYSRNKTSQESL